VASVTPSGEPSGTPPDEEFLFVYGTLRSEFENAAARKLRSEAHLIGPATVRGSIFRIRHYPGFLPDPDGIVTGELYRLADPPRTLAALDRYEGSEYSRAPIALGSGGAAWIYLYTGRPHLESRIESGDFCKP
jgi:gamma-glutamylcyclotransferase (GGCT)/AIG2-like uncharacterized protein YtfP